jgi:hypothetical protein
MAGDYKDVNMDEEDDNIITNIRVLFMGHGTIVLPRTAEATMPPHTGQIYS